MNRPKFKVGQKVLVKPLNVLCKNWEKGFQNGDMVFNNTFVTFTEEMKELCGKIVTIRDINEFRYSFDKHPKYFLEEMGFYWCESFLMENNNATEILFGDSNET